MIKTKWIENQLRNWIVNVFEEDEKSTHNICFQL